MLRRLRAALTSLLVLVTMAGPALGQAAAVNEGVLIRDTEIENIIRAYAEPVFGAAGMNADDIRVHILHDESLNAFVIDGFNMFIHTGLMREADNAEQLIGVIAHETGHIAGGHVAKLTQQVKGIADIPLIAMIVGVGLGVLAQDSRATVAAASLGNHLAQRQFLAYARGHENSADQLGLRYLDEAGISAEGLLSFLGRLQNEEYLVVERQSPYVRTHPITSQRIEFVRRHVEQSPATGKSVPPAFEAMHARLHAKLDGFLDFPNRTLAKYKETDDSIPARYARAIAYHRDAQTRKALGLIDGLIADHPGDAYFHELKGQILFESGRPADAAEAYSDAVELMPEAPLIRTALAQALNATEAPGAYEQALQHLQASVRKDKRYPMTWLQMAIAYGRTGEMGQSALAGAEYNVLVHRYEDARAQVLRAEDLLEQGSPGWQRAQDIKRQLDQVDEREQG